MRTPRLRLVAGCLLAVSILEVSSARAMCIPFPCDDCELQSTGQLNWVVMDRRNGRVVLIPNIRIEGTGEDFALLLPAPSVPEVGTVPAGLWTQAFALTAPINQTSSSGSGSGCGRDLPTLASPPGSTEDDAVDILRQQTVGAFLLTTLQATSAEGLVTWLADHGFALESADAERFRPYTERGWVFCAMRLDRSRIDLTPPWDLNVDPVAFTFPGTDFEVPLAILDINRGGSLPMAFFVVDEHRMELPGFRLTYANSVSRSEYAAIQQTYPILAEYLQPGSFVTRLDRTFLADDVMTGSLALDRAPEDREFRRTTSGWGIAGGWGPLVLAALVLARRRRRDEAVRLRREPGRAGRS